jgi:hypothetical protein
LSNLISIKKKSIGFNKNFRRQKKKNLSLVSDTVLRLREAVTRAGYKAHACKSRLVRRQRYGG